MSVSWQEWAKKIAENINDHQRKLQKLSTQFDNLEAKLGPLFDFWMERQILITLRNEGKPRTKRWLWRRLGHDIVTPLGRLVNKGLVTTEWSGPHLLYKLAEGDVHGEG